MEATPCPETLEHRRARNRDGATDSPFTMMVLELEQAMLEHQASKAKIIISKCGELLSYGEKNYEQIAGKGYMTYDFFLPGLIIDALESGDGKHLFDWAKELIEKDIHTVNMLGCHDGIPLLDLKGLLSEEHVLSGQCNLLQCTWGRRCKDASCESLTAVHAWKTADLVS